MLLWAARYRHVTSGTGIVSTNVHETYSADTGRSTMQMSGHVMPQQHNAIIRSMGYMSKNVVCTLTPSGLPFYRRPQAVT